MRILEKLRSTPKRVSAVVAVAIAVVTVPAALLAWGPARDTYTIEKPADHVVFNSITNNPVHGDERNFVQVKESTAPDSSYTETANLTAGKQYTVFVYYHNNAATSLNASGVGIAKDVKARVEIPAVVAKGGAETTAVGYISASNANPGTVWDNIAFKNTSAGDMALRYVPGSATIHNKGKANGMKVADTIVTTGASLGYDSLNGVVPGCNDYSGYVTFNVQADQPNFEITKQVRKLGETSAAWRESAAVNPGDKVEYLIHYKNNGTTQQNNVLVKDQLPKGVSYVAGTTKIQNALNPNGKVINDDVVTQGVNISNYTAGSGAYVWFTAQVDAASTLPCGPSTFVNKASVETANGSKQDTANVTVNKECQPEAAYTCDSLSVQKLSDTSFKFSTAYTLKNATLKSITYVVRNAAGTEVYRGPNATYTGTVAGKYTVESIVTVTVNGVDKTAPGNCKGSFEVCIDIKKIQVCELATKKIVTINESDFDASKYSKNLDDCKTVPPTMIKVCELATKKIVTINEKDFDASKYSKNLDDCKTVVPNKITVCELATKAIVTIDEQDFDASKYSKDLNDCKTVTPKTIEVCELATKKIITIDESAFDASKHSTDKSKCNELPPELPKTGAADVVAKLAGVVSLAGATAYYVTSRRNN